MAVSFALLPAAMITTFGEPVIYTPVATGRPVAISGIWTEGYVGEVFAGSAGADGRLIKLDIRIADLPDAPQEGDLVRRVATGFDGQVVPPIRPDNIGIVSLTVQQLLP